MQRKWLQQLAKQLAFETIVDRRFVNARFADKGGARQLDKVLDEIDEIADHLWQQPA
ncbi:type I restriction enzyme EcoKI subunit R [Thiorhodococcus drewsii AZ1]|uniref:Type I restriction enzyme EcoKI subunit R n=1 Tax=Thiorhodococcus drewsii AZ1 TaxID=765913 RepID=G2E5C4_9GAMM|nr:type I restriction enzyme EcoKI subunit R [Thiorhodococcus drewsii AZ1]